MNAAGWNTQALSVEEIQYTMPITILSGLPLALLRFELETLEAASVPPYKGDLLRMALLWWLSEFWCPEPTRCREGCRKARYLYVRKTLHPCRGFLLVTTKCGNCSALRAPGAYVLWDERDAHAS
jgi:hypothetical protein